MTGWRRAARAVVAVLLALVTYFVVPVHSGGDDLALRLVVSALTFALLAALVVWQMVLQAEYPQRRVDGLVFAVVVAVLVFALAFYRLETADPGQIPGLVTRLDSLYFTMTTLLTIGFGDIHAERQTARALVLVQMVFNVAIIATAANTVNSRVRRRAEERAEARRAAEGSASGAQREPRHPRRTHRNPT